MRNLKIDSNKDYGLLVVRGQLHLDNDTNVQVSGSRFGLWTNVAAVSIDSWDGPTSSDYPYYLSRGSLDMRGCIIANGVIGVYAHTLSSITLQKCRIRDQSNHGLFVHLPGRLSVDSCSIESVRSHALYCNTAGVPGETVSINNLSVSNSQIAARFIGVPISSKNLQSLVLRNNAHGLRVEQATLDLSPEMNIDATGNQYAVMSYNGRLVADGYSSADNLFALYVFRSPTELINTKLSGKSYGALFYGSKVSASGLSVSASNYGIYHDPQNQKDCPLSIVDSQFNDIGSFAIRAVGRDNSKEVELKNLQIIGGNYGLYFSNNKVVAEDIRCSDVKFYAYFANNSESQLRRLVSNRCGSWAIYGLAGSLSLFDSQVHGGQGVLLATQSSSAVNCIVSGAAYGFYLNRRDGEYAVLNSTISGIRIDGILANRGKVKIVNSIIQSGRFGIHDVTGSNSIHDYNVITSGRAPFRNTVAEKNEILKPPMFVNAASGDFRLTSGSPAINSGRDLSAVSKTDIVGAARGSYGRFEIGAYEFTEKHGSLRVLDWDETAE